MDVESQVEAIKRHAKNVEFLRTSSPKGNDAHLRATIQREKNGNINFSDA